MKTFNELVIEGAAKTLNSSEETIRLEAANHPRIMLEDEEGLTIRETTQKLVNAIRQDREAESAFFAAHPELNP